MSDQSALDSESSMACARCGGRTSESASFCEHCGARLALAGGASFAPHAYSGDVAAATRFEPPMRSFAPTDFEGDLDAPPGGLPDSPEAPYSQVRASAFLRWRQWGLKSRVGVLLAACAVLLGGVAALHRYDEPAISPVIQEGAPKSADGSIAPNGSTAAANGDGTANDGRRALAAPGQWGAGQTTSGSMSDATNPRVANEGVTGGFTQTNPNNASAGKQRNGARSRAHVRAHHHSHRRYWRRPSPNSLYQHSDVKARWWVA